MKRNLVAWVELTSKQGPKLNEFYSTVLDVDTAPVPMNGHDDYNVPAEDPAFGICHPASSQDQLDRGWIVYLHVHDLDHALMKAKDLGAEVIMPPQHTSGYGTHALIRDPDGNTTALYETDG